MSSQFLILYLCIVSGVGIGAIIWANCALGKIKTSRSKRIRDLKNLDSIETTSPHENGETAEMEKAPYQCWAAGWTDSVTKVWNLASDIRTGIAMQFQIEGIKALRFGIDMGPSAQNS